MIKPGLTTIFLIMFLLSSAIILFNQSGPVSSFRSYISELLRPFEIIFNKIGNGFLFWQNAFLNIKHIKDLNAELTAENLELTGKLAELSQLKEENALLREKLNFSSRNLWNTSLAKVIGRDFENNRSFLIDKGSNDGMEVGMPVIFKGGVLVGKINEVNYNTSKVTTIIDVQSKVAAIIQGNDVSGLVRGLGSDLIFDLIAKNKKPETGDLIISSGADSLWPRGLLIGKIKTVKSEDSQIFNTANIDLLVDFRNFNDVFVILNKYNAAK